MSYNPCTQLTRDTSETKPTADGKTKGERADKGKKFSKLVEHLRGLQANGFTGYIRVNFSQGHIGRVEKFEEILKK